MGRLFITNLEGPVYKCKQCEAVELAVYDPSKRLGTGLDYTADVGKIYCFLKFFNVVKATDEITITLDGEREALVNQVFCIACSSLLGYYYGDAPTFNEGNFYIKRLKLRGPVDGSDDEALGGDGEAHGTDGEALGGDGEAHGTDGEALGGDGEASGSQEE